VSQVLIAKAPRVGAFLFACWVAWAGAAPGGPSEALVAKVSDGDSLMLADGRALRLVGINAPELGKDGAPDEPLAGAARAEIERLVAGKRVHLILDEEHRDRHGRLLAHVALPDGAGVAERLLEQGLACVIAVSPNLLNLTRYLDIEASARHAKRSLWGHAYFAPRAADAVHAHESGFRFVRGGVQRVGESRNHIYLDLGTHLSITIAHADWRRYFNGRPADYLRRTIEVRGWITEQNDKLRIRVHHPAMITQP
jgi:endonuclease YncB( thermonuclease family)